jgi:ribonuclease J
MVERARGGQAAQSQERQGVVRLIPLGGLGEFGMNCMVLESGNQRVVIDCGVQFPEKEHYGIDLLIPDFSYLRTAPGGVTALVITHGHEDHIGAIPYLIKALGGPVPLYATDFTLALIKRRLEEHGLWQAQAPLAKLVKTGERVEIGPRLSAEFIHVNHSIPASASVAFTTPAGVILHTGDWRMDLTPQGEPPIDLAAFARIGEKGVVAMISDSTNVQRPGINVSELQVGQHLEDLMDLAPGRLLITLFSTHAWRVRAILQAARRIGRKVAILGRSLQQNLQTAIELGYIDAALGQVLIDITEVDRHPEDEVAILVSGTQGEWQASLTRVANGEHKLLALRKGDWVVYSSRFIPGNERAIGRVISKLVERGAKVITPGERVVHCSGHASRDEARLLLHLVKPQTLIPAHGEYQQLHANADLAREMGIKSIPIIIDGDVLEIHPDGSVEKGKRINQVGSTFVDGIGIGDVEDAVLRNRQKLSAAGIVVIALSLDSEKLDLLAPPEIVMHGIASDSVHELMLHEVKSLVEQSLADFQRSKKRLSAERTTLLSDQIQDVLRRFFNRKMDRKPVIIPVINEVTSD